MGPILLQLVGKERDRRERASSGGNGAVEEEPEGSDAENCHEETVHHHQAESS